MSSSESPANDSGRLGLGPAADKHAADAAAGLAHARVPEDRLADSRLAGEEEGARSFLDPGEERLEQVELVLAPDEGGARTGLPIVTERRARGGQGQGGESRLA